MGGGPRREDRAGAQRGTSIERAADFRLPVLGNRAVPHPKGGNE